jgi:SOS-response transcriptional repressor LexA
MTTTQADDRRRCIYHFIVAYCMNTCGIPPTYQEIVDHCGLHSKSTASRLIASLVRRGLLSIENLGNRRVIRVTRATWRPPLTCGYCDRGHARYWDWCEGEKR